MEIRKANSQDAEKLSEIAFASKSHWNYPANWLKIWKNALTITPEIIEKNEVYLAAENDSALGFYVLSVSGKTAILEHLWINFLNIGRGIGRALFLHAREKAVFLKAKIINIESDPNAEKFYLKMGAKRVGEVVSEIEGEKRVLPLMQIVL